MNKPPAIVKINYPGIEYINVDQYGLLGHAYPRQGGVEGGDSASWNGHFKYFGKKQGFTNDLDYVRTFEVAFGGYVRHPYKDPIFNRFGSFYKNVYCSNISRDQALGIILGIIAAGDKMAMLRFCLAWAARGFLFSSNTVHNGQDPEVYKFNLIKFFRNKEQLPYYKIPDPTGPSSWATTLRGFGLLSWIFFPLLVLLDIHVLLSTFDVNKTDDDDVMNYFGRLAVSRDYVPTPTSWLSMKLLDREHLKSRIKAYWIGWRDQPGMADIHCKAIEELK